MSYQIWDSKLKCPIADFTCEQDRDYCISALRQHHRDHEMYFDGVDNPHVTPLDLMNLVNQYRSDIEQRIARIRAEWDEADDAVYNDEDCVDEYEAQIARWNATLKHIDEVLKHDDSI